MMLKKLKETLSGLSDKELSRVATACGTTVRYLTEQIANGHRRASVRLAKKLVRELPAVTLSDVRPDIYEPERIR